MHTVQLPRSRGPVADGAHAAVTPMVGLTPPAAGAPSHVTPPMRPPPEVAPPPAFASELVRHLHVAWSPRVPPSSVRFEVRDAGVAGLGVA